MKLPADTEGISIKLYTGCNCIVVSIVIAAYFKEMEEMFHLVAIAEIAGEDFIAQVSV